MREVCKTQKTKEWFDARCGIVTGSAVSRTMAFLKRASGEKKAGDSSADRDNYMMEIASEILTGQPVEHYVTPYMDDGAEREPVARAEYMFTVDDSLEQTGFVLHPTMDRFGSSPDGYTVNGVLEMKCPQAKTHLAHVQAGIVPPEYIDQLDSEILCCEKEWGDFYSFAPMIMVPEMRAFRVRRYRDEVRFKQIEEAVSRFNEEVLQLIERLQRGTAKLAKAVPA